MEIVTDAELVWPMGTQESIPYYSIGTGYSHQFKVDPYPCYSHPAARVREVLDLCERVFPLDPPAPAKLWILGHEDIGRFNGTTFQDALYRRPDGSDWKEKVICRCGCGKILEHDHGLGHSIVLGGKRIPIMPAMTRYLVAHEYGHAVFNFVARAYGYEYHHDKLEAKYMEVRGVTDFHKGYAGGKWHRAPSEIIANDFRLLFTGMEPEFWPHEVPAPSHDSPIGAWWREARRRCDASFDPASLSAPVIAIESAVHKLSDRGSGSEQSDD